MYLVVSSPSLRSTIKWQWVSWVWFLAEGCSPGLVVDSSISNVTANTVIPNHMLLPRISDLMQCAPSESAVEQVVHLTLDVSKAHRRILIHPADRGLLCFHVGDELYQCLCLNVGARASGWYWGRVAGLMVRTSHALLDHHHALWQYVDDLLAWLDKRIAPLWASALIILFLLLGIPMSWHKASLAPSLTWIGWHICIETWTVQIPETKLASILTQIKSLQKQDKVPLRGCSPRWGGFCGSQERGIISDPYSFHCIGPFLAFLLQRLGSILWFFRR